jgi:hypothetical protein
MEGSLPAGVPERIPHDFLRTAVRNLERAGVPRSVAMTGQKTEAVYRRYAIVCEADLVEGLKKLAALQLSVRETVPTCGTVTDLSHSLATVSEEKGSFAAENMVEAARVELASEDRQRTGSTCVAERFGFATIHARRPA